MSIDSVTYENAYTSALEVFLFARDKPEQVFCYPQDGYAVTWMGDKLSQAPMCMGKKWRDNFGGDRQSVRFVGRNGCLYSGTLYGTYIRAKRYN